ncbi:MAG: hypothetical protein M3257_07295 [Actinomycetota bacterium]|nr:hypothetical protein [Actinomycetota bacterium]
MTQSTETSGSSAQPLAGVADEQLAPGQHRAGRRRWFRGRRRFGRRARSGSALAVSGPAAGTAPQELGGPIGAELGQGLRDRSCEQVEHAFVVQTWRAAFQIS